MSVLVLAPPTGLRAPTVSIDWPAYGRAAGLGLGWALVAFEAAMMAAPPVAFPAIVHGHLAPFSAQVLYETASRSHMFVLPPALYFLAFVGLPQLEAALRLRSV